MTCARLRRLEKEANDIALRRCGESADHLGLHMSCQDEYACPDAGIDGGCDIYKAALAEVTAVDEMMP